MNQGSWYEVRNLFLGLNHKPRNFRLAIKLARECPHPRAQWLCSLFPGKVPKTEWEIIAILQGSNDPDAYTFTGILYDNYESLLHGANNGSVLAQSLLLPFHHEWHDNVSINHKDDPMVLYNLAKCYRDRMAALPFVQRAAELGHVDAMIEYSEIGYTKFDCRRLLWYTNEVLHTQRGKRSLNALLVNYPNLPNQFLYHLGALLSRRVSGPTKFVTLYEDSRYLCRHAVTAWLIVAYRLRVIKDIRTLIGAQLWKCAWKWMEKEDYMEQRKIHDFFKRLKNA